MLLAIYAYAVGNMDVKSVDTLNYLLFHLRLGPPTFRPPLRLKFFWLFPCFFPQTPCLFGRKVKLCFVGHARAGKTSTLLALADKPFDTQQPHLGEAVFCKATKGGPIEVIV